MIISALVIVGYTTLGGFLAASTTDFSGFCVPSAASFESPVAEAAANVIITASTSAAKRLSFMFILLLQPQL
jgi:Na+/proline symporter